MNMDVSVRKEFQRSGVGPVVLLAGLLTIACIAADERADLSTAIRQGNLAGVMQIVDRNPALVKSADDSGFTPLHIAATAGRVATIEFLLSRGADIEARTSGGQTPLFQTIPLAAGDAFVCLLGRGARLDERDYEGRNILQFALFWQRPRMVDLILSRGFLVSCRGAEMREMLEAAANAGMVAVVSELVSKGAILDTTKENGTTLLHSAARGGLVALAEQLLGKGAPMDERDLHGLTPLHLASFYGRDDVVRLLIAHSADVRARGTDGRTASNMAEDAGFPSAASPLRVKEGARESRVWPMLTGPYLDQPEPDDEPSMFAPGIISSEEHETNIAFAPDGAELCFSRINADQSRRRLFFMRHVRGRWSAPSPAAFESSSADFEGSYSTDGRRLFFSSNRPPLKGMSPRRDMDIWVVERAGAGWGAPRNLGPAVNSPSNEYMPTADRAGNLYFERFGLNVAHPSEGGYSIASKIAQDAGNAANPGHPFVSPDGSFLLFDARPPGGRKAVLFVSFRSGEDTWSRAVRLFERSEPHEYESCPTLSPDGKFLFFGRDHDIYWVRADVIRRARSSVRLNP
jgi:ankyrin repeat protein